MSATNNSVSLKFAYHNTDFTRVYKLDNVPDSALDSVKSKVKAINASMSNIDPEHTSVDVIELSVNFVADEYDKTTWNSTGHFKEISEATVVVEEVTKIPLF